MQQALCDLRRTRYGMRLTIQALCSALLGFLAVASFGIAIGFERRMQRHRQPGVTYADVTLRRDGAWRRADLFTPEGLALQKQASRFGLLGALFAMAALIVWVAFGVLG